MDQQVVDWCKEMMGLPASASGTLVSGGSMANIIGLTVARNAKAGIDVREHGVAAIAKPLRFYGSDQVHSCHRKAMEALGLGNRALRRIPTDAELRIDLAALRAAIAEDRAAGLQPACVIGTAGTSQHRRNRRSAGSRELWRPRRTSGSMSMAASARSSPSPRTMPIASRGSSVPIPSRSIRINGCMRRSRPAAP